MIFSEFQGLRLPLLGFGAMRLPLQGVMPGAPVDEQQTEAMMDYAMAHGVNYFDTAYPYHGGESERIVGRILAKYPRESFYLATKYPGHQISASYDPKAVFEDQLHKCGVEYFDFYLLHNISEISLQTYTDPRWGIIDYFLEQKRLGRVKHLGFSCHGRAEFLRDFLDKHGDAFEFCQIQLNYLDWTLQNAKDKYDAITAHGLGVWVMEPVHGGRLAKLDEADEAALKAMRPDESVAAWCFRFLQELPNVKMILSGMSNMEQMEDNVHSFEMRKPLASDEREKLLHIAEGMKNSVPCTGCRYCCEGCPMGLDLPMLLSTYNEVRFSPAINAGMRIEALPEDKRPAACIACGACVKACPQAIDIPAELKAFDAALSQIPSWIDICRKRDEVQRRNAGK